MSDKVLKAIEKIQAKRNPSWFDTEYLNDWTRRNASIRTQKDLDAAMAEDIQKYSASLSQDMLQRSSRKRLGENIGMLLMKKFEEMRDSNYNAYTTEQLFEKLGEYASQLLVTDASPAGQHDALQKYGRHAARCDTGTDCICGWTETAKKFSIVE